MGKNASKASTDIVTKLKGANAAIIANVDPTEAMTLGGTKFTPSEVTVQFDGYITVYGDATTAKADAATKAKAWATTKPEAKQMWDEYVQWVEVTFGKDPATKAKFNIPVPAPRPTKTPEEKSVANAKRRQTLAQKKAQKAAAAPKTATVVAYDANGNLIGAPPPVAAGAVVGAK